MGDKPIYHKVSRRGGAVMSYYQLWQGPDHLLWVKETGCMEEYKRFYYRDIQAFVMVRSDVFLAWNLIFLVTILILLAATVCMHHTGRYVTLGFFILTGTGWLIHVLRGPTCKCWLQTEVNKEQLAMFSRVAEAHRFLKKIEPEILAAQGSLSMEELNAELSGA